MIQKKQNKKIIRSASRYDDRERLKEYYRIDEKGDTAEAQRYEWKNGRLVRMTANGVVRKYIYGKTLRDTVRVVPADDDMFLHPGYDRTAGIIPEEDDPAYRLFAIAPYTYYVGNAEEEPAIQKPVSPLLKVSVNSSCVSHKRSDILLECKRYEKEDVVALGNILIGYFPGANSDPTYGDSKGHPIFDFKCKCDSEDGYFYFEYSDKLQNKRIEIMESNWKHHIITADLKYWKELCWSRNDMQRTYEHELKHIENAEKITERYFTEYMSKEKAKSGYKIRTKEECEKKGWSLISDMIKKWNLWSGEEKKHNNKGDPKSPAPTGPRKEVSCPMPSK